MRMAFGTFQGKLAKARTMNNAIRPEVKYILKSARTGRQTIAVNVKESPITYYFHRGWIDEHQRDAGEIFRDLWEGSLIGNKAIYNLEFNEFENLFSNNLIMNTSFLIPELKEFDYFFLFVIISLF